MLDARDSRGGFCDDGNYDSGNICGLYDNAEFTANQMCCHCGGGFSWDQEKHTFRVNLQFQTHKIQI
jgi:hypothetical protein